MEAKDRCCAAVFLAKFVLSLALLLSLSLASFLFCAPSQNLFLPFPFFPLRGKREGATVGRTPLKGFPTEAELPTVAPSLFPLKGKKGKGRKREKEG